MLAALHLPAPPFPPSTKKSQREKAARSTGPHLSAATTDACEAPPAFWDGAIPLREKRLVRDGHSITVAERTYSHPLEKAPNSLTFDDINTMYCIGNDELMQYFPEGVGGRVSQLFPPGHPRGFLYRRQSHLLSVYIDKIAAWKRKQSVLKTLTNGRCGIIFDGASGTGKSALLCQAVHFARARGILTVYVPNAKDWTHGEWCWPSTLLPGFWDAPDATRAFLAYFSRAHQALLSAMPLRATPSDLPLDSSETAPKTLYDLCQWGGRAVAPASVDRQSVAIKYVMDELMAEKQQPVLFVIDGLNLFSHESHFRYPHPDFYKTIKSFSETDVDMYPQELPRIPAARFTFVRALNQMMLSGDNNKFFVACSTRYFKPFDGGVSGMEEPVFDASPNALDEYTPFDPEKDTVLHPMAVGDFDEYEYRAFLRFLINSGELAGFGWGPLWHYSPSFERKLYKIEFMSQRNPQRVIDHYHQELVWRWDYERLRQKQYLQQQAKMRTPRASRQIQQ